MPLEKVDTQVNFPELERDILAFWDKTQAFAALREKNRGKPKWSFLDGPITANNPMGVHHAWGRTYKDAYSRYFAMTGHELRYQNGFDCQGLWVEVEVEKALGFKGKPEQIYALCLSVAAGAAIAIGVWTVAPSFGAFSVYVLPAQVADHLALALDGHYAKDLVALLAHGPGRISPSAAQGLIGFPSYHAVLALLVVWYARKLAVIRWIALALNAVVLVATPIQGGHHVVDVLAGFAVAAAAIWFADILLRFAARAEGGIGLKTQAAAG